MEILSSQVVHYNYIAIAFAFLLFTVMAIWYSIDDIGLGVLFEIVGVVTLVLIFISTYHEPYNTYKVTINESVNFNEFIEKYEILGQEGKIYTVKERNDK